MSDFQRLEVPFHAQTACAIDFYARALIPFRRQMQLRLALAAFPLLSAVSLWASPRALAVDFGALSRLLLERSCEHCDLRGADLVHAELSHARLASAQLYNANLSQSNLNWADLSGADLRGAIFAGASLRGANLRGAQLQGANLLGADLSHAQLDPSALSHSHWRGAIGMDYSQFSASELHNAAVVEAEAERWPAAERLYSAALAVSAQEPLTWAGRGISRASQGLAASAASDFAQAATLYAAQGQLDQTARLEALKVQVLKSPEPRLSGGGNGLGGAALEGALSAAGPLSSVMQGLAPLALKFLLPLPF